LTNNLDRFSQPFHSERLAKHFLSEIIEEQTALNKRDIVDQYISWHFNQHGLIPEAEAVQERFYQIDLDLDMIEERIMQF
jgi:hypothetical protein